MVGEVRLGKRTIVEHEGREFELPEQHRIEMYAGKDARETYVSLSTPGEGSLFRLRDLEQRDDAVVVHLGEWMGSSGPASFGFKVAEPTGYPFPE